MASPSLLRFDPSGAFNPQHGLQEHDLTALAPSLFEAQEGEGARDVFSRLGILVREHAVDDPGILLDVDKPGDLRKLRSRDRK